MSHNSVSKSAQYLWSSSELVWRIDSADTNRGEIRRERERSVIPKVESLYDHSKERRQHRWNANHSRPRYVSPKCTASVSHQRCTFPRTQRSAIKMFVEWILRPWAAISLLLCVTLFLVVLLTSPCHMLHVARNLPCRPPHTKKNFGTNVQAAGDRLRIHHERFEELSNEIIVNLLDSWGKSISDSTSKPLTM